MSNHYYSEKQTDLKSNPQEYKFNFKENVFTFKTDSGVFSKNYIDFGTFTMLNNFIPNDIDAPILDIGCGYGPVGVVISKLYNKNIIMTDINERAISLSLDNIKINKATTCKCFKSNLYDELKDYKFSSIITNPPIRAGKQVVQAIYNGAYDHLIFGGELWVVIQKKQGAPSSKDFLTILFGNCEIIDKEKGYYILKSIKNI